MSRGQVRENQETVRGRPSCEMMLRTDKVTGDLQARRAVPSWGQWG